MTIGQIGNKEKNLMKRVVVLGKTQSMAFHKDLFFVHYNSIHHISINIYVTFFYSCENQGIASCVDDTTVNSVEDKKESVINTLETSPLLVFE